MNISKYTEKAKAETLKDICKQIAEMDTEDLEGLSAGLLSAIIPVLDEQSQDDAWGTEGWEHYFGL